MKRALMLVCSMVFFATGCQSQSFERDPAPVGMRPRMGMDPGMMDRHRASIPDPYAGKTNPVVPTEQALANGDALYAVHCTSCHGDGGMGDGPAGQALNPPAAPIAHTSPMVGDDYLFWRISEGGAAFGTAMPAWKGTLSDDEIWVLIHYSRALGQGQMQPLGETGAINDPAVQTALQTEMLSQAVSQGVITQHEADVFAAVHAALDSYLVANPGTGNAPARQAAGLASLVEAGTITQLQADSFLDVHDRLLEAGLMR